MLADDILICSILEDGEKKEVLNLALAKKIKGQNHLFLQYKKRVKRDAQQKTKNNGSRQIKLRAPAARRKSRVAHI